MYYITKPPKVPECRRIWKEFKAEFICAQSTLKTMHNTSEVCFLNPVIELKSDNNEKIPIEAVSIAITESYINKVDKDAPRAIKKYMVNGDRLFISAFEIANYIIPDLLSLHGAFKTFPRFPVTYSEIVHIGENLSVIIEMIDSYIKDSGGVMPPECEKNIESFVYFFTIPETGERIHKLKFSKVAESYKKTKQREHNKTQFIMPTSPATHLVLKGISNASRLEVLRSRENQLNHSKKTKILKNGNAVKIEQISTTSTIEIEFENINKILRSNTTVNKLFLYCLAKINEQATYNGNLKRDYISFPLCELVDIDMYSDISNARRGIKTAFEVLTKLSVSSEGRRGKNKYFFTGVLFPSAKINNSHCEVALNKNISWAHMLEYFTLLPKNAFSLKSTAFSVSYLIAYFARQNIDNIKKTGGFNISFKTIQNFLGLPDENKTKKPRRDIISVIESAIDEIADNDHGKSYYMTPLILEKPYETATTKEILESGYIRIEPKHEYKNYFVEEVPQNKNVK